MKGRIARRAMELGGFPMRSCSAVVVAQATYNRQVVGSMPTRTTKVSEARLVQAMRRIDPDLADMIESLAPVCLVKG